MSYDFAVWEGPPPLSNVHGASEFERRRMAASSPIEDALPCGSIRNLVTSLLSVYPDRDAPGVVDSPWVDAPLINNAIGTMAYLRVVESHADAVRKLIDDESARLGLVAYDPQAAHLVPSATTVVRASEFELPDTDDLCVHLQAVMGEALGAATPMVGVLEERATGYYVQWMADRGAIVLEAQGEDVLAAGLRTQPEGQSVLHSLGFDQARPNWRCLLENGSSYLDHAARTLAHVLTEVRRIPPGAKMRIETFPIPI